MRIVNSRREKILELYLKGITIEELVIVTDMTYNTIKSIIVTDERNCRRELSEWFEEAEYRLSKK